MRTPSLRARVVTAGVVVVLLVVVTLDVFLYASLRASLLTNLESVLAARARLVEAEAARLPPEALATRLTELGLRATVHGPDGRSYRAEPASLSLGANLASEQDSARGLVSRRVELPGGTSAVVYARRSGVDRALNRLLMLEAAGTVVAAALAALLLFRASGVALAPLNQIAGAACRAAGGRRGERLRPERTDTELGQVASAYDDMLESLEAALDDARHAQARAHQVIETSGEAYVAIDQADTIVDWNAQAERTFGWSRDEATGRKLVETVVPPDQRQAHLKGMARYLATGEAPLLGRRVELVALHRLGHTFPVELTLWATGTEGDPTFHAFVHDISERRKGEDARARLASIVESSNDAIISTDLEDTILTWNHAAERIFGYPATEAVGQPISLIVPPERQGEVAQLSEHARRGEPVRHHESVRRSKNGADIDVALTMSPIHDAAGTVVGISTIARDISEQRWMARTLDSTLHALEDALAQARGAEAVTSQFLADAAHQLRTPMASLQACAETLVRGPPPDDRDRLITHVVRETARASRLVNGLLKMAHVDQGQTLAPERCDVVALCHEEAERARELAPHLEVSVRVTHLPDQQPELDAAAVREVLANLLDNARRHALRRIEVTVGECERGIEVKVVDDGPGVADELVERVFERFVTLDKKGGSGLGLPIARGLARAHGGDLTYEDRAFVVRLPVTSGVNGDFADSRSRP